MIKSSNKKARSYMYVCYLFHIQGFKTRISQKSLRTFLQFKTWKPGLEEIFKSEFSHVIFKLKNSILHSMYLLTKLYNFGSKTMQNFDVLLEKKIFFVEQNIKMLLAFF